MEFYFSAIMFKVCDIETRASINIQRVYEGAVALWHFGYETFASHLIPRGHYTARSKTRTTMVE